MQPDMPLVALNLGRHRSIITTTIPTMMQQTLGQQCMRTSWTTAKPVHLSSATQESQNGRVLQRGGGEKSKFQPTSVLQPLLPGPPILLLLGPTNSWYVRSFRREAASRALPSTLAARAFRNNFHAAPILHLAPLVPRCPGRLCTAGESLTANSCANALNCKPPPKNPCSATRCAWWPNESSGRPHRQVRETRGNGKRRRRNKSTRNGGQSWCIMERCGQQCCTRQWTTLGTQRGLFILAQPAQKELSMKISIIFPMQTLS